MRLPDRHKFNFDTALRYQPIVKIIEESKWKNQPILEVGSGGSGISDYYPGEVIGLDSDFTKTATEKNANMIYVKGSADRLPFRSGSFYLVICLDTLEHIEKKIRSNVIEELVRICKKGGTIFLGFPTGKLSEQYEIKINNAYKRVYHKDHLWLLEHQKYGLPNYQDVLATLRKLGIPAKKIKVHRNLNIFIWYIIHLLFTVYPDKFFSRILKYVYFPIFYIAGINLPPFYRVILVINK